MSDTCKVVMMKMTADQPSQIFMGDKTSTPKYSVTAR